MIRCKYSVSGSDPHGRLTMPGEALICGAKRVNEEIARDRHQNSPSASSARYPSYKRHIREASGSFAPYHVPFLNTAHSLLGSAGHGSFLRRAGRNRGRELLH